MNKKEWKQNPPQIVKRLAKINSLVAELVTELAKRDAKKAEKMIMMHKYMNTQRNKNNG